MKILRIFGKVLVVLLVIVAIALGLVYWRSEKALAQRFTIDEAPLSIPTDAAAIARGEHLAITQSCQDCHAPDMGGAVVVDVLPVGRLAAANLTRGKGGAGATLDAQTIEHAIRHGIAPDGRPLLFMPSSNYHGLSDADVADLIAYIQSRAPVDRDLSPSYAGPLSRTLFLLGKMPLVDALHIDQLSSHIASIEPAATADYGKYLAKSACSGCHGDHYSGGRVPGTPPSFPPAQNITPDKTTGIGNWSKADFYTALRTAKRPDGSALDPFMPVPALSKLTDVELDAVWAYLQTVPAAPSGGH